MNNKPKNPGSFQKGSLRARVAGKKGGKVSPGNFKYNRELAVSAGRKGGLAKATDSKKS